MTGKVFISYRREDSRYQARQIYQAFLKELPRDQVFIDIDSIPPGEDFTTFLGNWVNECQVLVAIIGEDWIISKDPKSGQRRLDNPDDFVRIEISEALKRGIPVVPVLIDAAQMPSADELPDGLKPLTRRNAEFVDFRTFDVDVRRLIDRLRAKGLGKDSPNNGGGLAARSWPHFLLRAAGLSSVALVIAYTAYQLWSSGLGTRDASRSSSPPPENVLAQGEPAKRSAEDSAGAAAAFVQAEQARMPAESERASARTNQAEEARRAAEAKAQAAIEALAQSEAARKSAEAEAAKARAREAETERQAAEAKAQAAAAAMAQSEAARKAAAIQTAGLPGQLSSPASHTLIDEMATSARWATGGLSNCNDSKRSYSFAVNGDSITWRDGEGNLDVEDVSYRSDSRFDTTTVKSEHAGSKTEKIGKTWIYERVSADRIKVRPAGKSPFWLVRCR